MNTHFSKLLFICFLALSTFVQAEIKVGGIKLPVSRNSLELRGAGVLRKGFFFKIYLGALYTARDADISEILNDAPKQLDIYYYHNTAKKHMIKAAETTLKENLSEQEYNEIEPHIKRLHEAFLDGEKGKYASIIFRPTQGLAYTYNSKEIITIADDAFAKHYFKVWLGEKPSSKTVKAALLTPIISKGLDE